ncbi:SPOR domain-containing protein [Brasilonema bromeliae]|uniref:SPOR domain-containing protein n=1 Tax=Brasilonema bromeliae SPC951 TaxID=385972 RepID=A0ABX1P6X7_9CYAN|nr:SPOR domain-containing protein [Brasilonema bromeliae]NMG20145.1 hypothetical protein [Brasilonema bromeliae SPC951]
MSENPLIDTSGAQSSKTIGLKPPLAAALASLEVQLDQELARYRRTRIGYRTPNQPRASISTSSKLQPFTVVSATASKTKSLPEENLKETFRKYGLATEKTHTPNTLLPQESILSETKINPAIPPVQIQNQVSASDTILDALLSPEISQSQTSASSKTENLQSHVDSIPSNFAEAQISLPSNAIVVRTQIQEPSQSQRENISNSQENTSKKPNDYLKSSEALLRSLVEDEPPKTQAASNSNNSLLSPLGIGSMLLLFLGSLTLGYIVFNFKTFPQISFDRLFQQNAPPTGQKTPESNKNVKTVAQPTFTPIPNLGTNSTPNSTATTSQKPDTEIKPSADGFYHVIIDNQGDSAFASARRVVPDAYLSPDGKIIYLGALKKKEQAQTLLQELKAQGINAKIQQP